MAKSHPVTTGAGPRPAIEWARRLPARAWQRLSAGPGAKGPRWYDWAFIEATDPAVAGGAGPHWLLIRRRISDGEYAFYRAHAPRPVPLAQLVKVAGSRWKIEEGFAAILSSPADHLRPRQVRLDPIRAGDRPGAGAAPAVRL